MDAVARDRFIRGDGTAADAWRGSAALAGVADAGAADLAPPGARLVVVAPHPDDEILACGGLLQLLADRPSLLVAVTDGEASHPGSLEWPVERLRAMRPGETEAALACLGVAPSVLRLGIPDGGVTAREAELADRLAQLLAPSDVVLTTWRYDGHPDHEATARACLAAARACGARTLEAPVWGWHWSAPDDGAMPLAHARRLALPEAVLARKRAAMACFASQVLPDVSRGAAPIVPPQALERVLTPFELFFHDPARPF
ncbi:PIG-L family deacetylase [Massilia sp. G4R7]|uniref:PIG-L family deacetylase n=1 Tax=Massilia phyllostachyos TaxID=2898585 RepID=A0ABS8Q7T2_9BURK|nr:PIG-L family deacetylase [Massilia phyllostachyos]MCD2517102.1 PIG-L family deacetylase [Massilia phyllostachyos]